MNQKEIDIVLEKHQLWIENKSGGVKADLLGADLQQANLRWADLQQADLRWANLQGADLRWADLQEANLRGADLQGADLRGADLDFAVFPLWCGSFNIKDDGKLAKQLLGHVARLQVTDKKLAAWIKTIPSEYKNHICKRHNIKEI